MSLRILIAAALLASSAYATPLTVWDRAKDGSPKTYRMGGYTLTVSAAKAGGQEAVTVRVNAPGAPAGVLKAEPGFDTPQAYFTVGWFDIKNPAPQVLVSTYTGGAHCCEAIRLLERSDAGWRTVNLGDWDGDVFEAPKDVDGDGTPDFVRRDNDFLYAFEAYAFSWAPPKILNIVDGKVVDVSAAPRYRALYLADMKDAGAECAKHSNGGCAGYVGDAARLGQMKDAWAFMLAHYDHSAPHFDYPARCEGRMVKFQCKGTPIKPRDYPQALAWFLKDHGYTQ